MPPRPPAERAVHHDGSPACVERLEGRVVRLRLFLPREERYTRVEVHLDQRANDPWVKMRRRRGKRLDRYEARVEAPGDVWTYRFRLQGEDGRQRWLDAAGLRPYRGGTPESFRVRLAGGPPGWVGDQVFYQIFPDRFRRGGGETATPRLPEVGPGKPRPVARRWGDLPRRASGGREFYGGDLDGVAEGLDYLQELGVTALYLNPIFESPSNHRYDTRSYHRVDPVLGGDDAYRRLVAALRARGMRLVLDGVFNHTGDECEWFDPGSVAAPGSFYTPTEGGSYVAWWGISTLPKLDFANPEVVDRVYRAEDSVVQRWLRGEHGADGWRLDVAACLGEGGDAWRSLEHLRELRDAARRARPDAYVMAEHFETAGFWLDAGCFDGVMNYSGFAFPAQEWVAGTDYEGHQVAMEGRHLLEAWATHRAGRTHGELLAAFNLLGSHDVPRIFTRLGEDPGRSLLAHALLFGYPGAPCVYYGDELGLEGGRDPDCRRTFPWDDLERHAALTEGIRALAGARARSAALRRGGFRPLLADGDTVAFARVLGEEVALVIGNRGSAPARVRLRLDGLGLTSEGFTDVLSGGTHRLRGGVLTLRVPGPGAAVLLEA